MSRENITRIKVVYTALGELAKDVVFVGGATVALYADRPAGEVRPTDDVDVLFEVLNYTAYAVLEAQLRSKGFEHDTASDVICRHVINGIIVDVMPTEESILGFSNKWYKEGFENSMTRLVEENYPIRLFQPVYFLASKLEAFKNRGGNEGRFSTDFEDIVYILNNRSVIWDELHQAPENVKQYLKKEILALLENEYIEEWISVHLDYNEQGRVRTIIGELTSFVES